MIYTKNNLLLFFAFCFLCGVSILLFTLLGSYLGKEGVLLGAMAGGMAGIVLTIFLGLRMQYLQRYQAATALAGAAIGFVLAALVTVNSLQGPLLPVLSILLIATGGVAGKVYSKQPD